MFRSSSIFTLFTNVTRLQDYAQLQREIAIGDANTQKSREKIVKN